MRRIAIDRERPDASALRTAADILNGGGVIVFPTDTLYGLIGRLDRPAALERIRQIKQQDDDKPMPCLAVDAPTALAAYFPQSPRLNALADRLWPGPVTLIGPAMPHLVGAATGNGPCIGIRVPDMPAIIRLGHLCDGALLAATSANPHGRLAAVNAAMMREYFGETDDLTFFDAGVLDSLGSTVVDLSVEPPRLVRRGEMPFELVERVLGRPLAEVLVRHDERLQDLMHGPLKIIQKTSGFRYSIDALLLAAFTAFEPEDRIADIGCGSGVIPLLVAGRGARKVVGIEHQEEIADMAARSIRANGLNHRASVVCGDARRIDDLFPAGSFDVVCANPPYYPAGSGHHSPDEAKAASRHELTMTLADAVRAAAWLVREGGRFFLIHLHAREDEVVAQFQANRLAPVRLRRVVTKPGQEPRFILVEGRKVAREDQARGFPDVIPDLALHDADGHFTKDADAFLAPIQISSISAG